MTLTHNVFLPWRGNCVHNLVQVGTFLFGALALTISSGYSYGPAILFVVSLAVCWRPSYWVSMPKEMKGLALVFIFYVLIQALSIWMDGGKLREFDRPSRVLMVVVILPLLARYPARLTSLISGVSVGACISGAIAIHDKLYLGMPRAFYDSMPIQSGNISMTMGLLCLCCYFWCRKEGNNRDAIVMLFSCGMGMLGSLLSGTRGGWVLLPMIVLSIIIYFRTSIIRVDKVVMALFCAAAIGLVFIPKTGMLSRIEAVKNDISNYVDGGNRNTSVGIRFQLWQSAFDAFLEKPIWDWGNNGVREAHAKQLADGRISHFVYDFNSHAHNQFLDEMAKRGLIGLTILLALFLYPLTIYARAQRCSTLPPILIGVSVMTLFDYSLTQAFISHNSGITFFPMIFSILVSIEADSRA
ncbi:O-antigen ligase family protein [Aeromonas veronii]|uniref:O-antigen ligase family protein n=1 Tax=Aeromonas veronii TaxID=654 RepID=UPI003D03C48B